MSTLPATASSVPVSAMSIVVALNKSIFVGRHILGIPRWMSLGFWHSQTKLAPNGHGQVNYIDPRKQSETVSKCKLLGSWPEALSYNFPSAARASGRLQSEQAILFFLSHKGVSNQPHL